MVELGNHYKPGNAHKEDQTDLHGIPTPSATSIQQHSHAASICSSCSRLHFPLRCSGITPREAHKTYKHAKKWPCNPQSEQLDALLQTLPALHI